MAIRRSSLAAAAVVPIGGPAGLPGRDGTNGKDGITQDVSGKLDKTGDASAATIALADASTGKLGDAVPSLAIARADIANRTIPLSSFVVGGFAAVGDDGAGARYVRGTSSGPMAIKDLAGTWWNLFIGGELARPEWFGYRGVGDAADMAAIQTALSFAAGIILRPGRTYLISAPIDLGSSGKIVLGQTRRLYPNFTTDWQTANPSWAGQSTTIQYVAGQHGAIFTGGDNSRLEGIVARCGQARTTADCLFAGTPSHVIIASCTFQNLDHLASGTTAAWGAWIVDDKTLVIGCGGVLLGRIVDCRFNGTTITSTAGLAFQVTAGGGDNIWHGCRMEFGSAPAIEIDANTIPNTIVVCIFDSHATVAVNLNKAPDGQVVIGNVFMRNGTINDGTPFNSSHMYWKATGRHDIRNNSYLAAAPDSGGTATPMYIIGLESCANAAIRFGGATRTGCTSSTIFKDLFSTSTNAIVADVLDLPAGAAPGTASDDAASALAAISLVIAGTATVNLYENRNIVGYVVARNLLVRGLSASPVQVANDNSGGAIGFAAMDNIKYGAVTYTVRRGQQYATTVPDGYGANGTWQNGDRIHNPSPSAGGFEGWVKVASGSPDTWKTFGSIAA